MPKIQIGVQTLNGRLPLEDGSDRHETLGKRVSDDSRHFFFDINQKKLDAVFRKNQKIRFFVCKSLVLEEQRFFERHRQIRRFLKLPAIFLFSRYDPWRRGKRVETFFFGSFGDENDQKNLNTPPWPSDLH